MYQYVEDSYQNSRNIQTHLIYIILRDSYADTNKFRIIGDCTQLHKN